MSMNRVYRGIVGVSASLLVLAATAAVAQDSGIDQPRLIGALHRHYSDLCFSSPSSGAVQTDNEILRTADGGQHWELAYTLPKGEGFHQLLCVQDLTVAFAYTGGSKEGPKLYRTLDGFAHVELLNIDFARRDKFGRSFVSDVFFLDAQHGWGNGNPHIAATSDGGHTWVGYLVDSDLGEPKRVIMFPPASPLSATPNPTPPPLEGIAETSKGLIRTANGGMDWRAIAGSPSRLRDLQCAKRELCVALEVDNHVSISVNGGNTWQPQVVPVDRGGRYDGRDDVHRLQVLSATRAYLFGIDSHLPPIGQREVIGPDGMLTVPRYPDTSFLVTYDGTSWTRRNYDNIEGLGIGQFVDEQNGWAVSDSNNIFRTTNGGQTWTTVQDYFRQIAALTPSPTPWPVTPTPAP